MLHIEFMGFPELFTVNMCKTSCRLHYACITAPALAGARLLIFQKACTPSHILPTSLIKLCGLCPVSTKCWQ
jgi:hypothetical protein